MAHLGCLPVSAPRNAVILSSSASVRNAKLCEPMIFTAAFSIHTSGWKYGMVMARFAMGRTKTYCRTRIGDLESTTHLLANLFTGCNDAKWVITCPPRLTVVTGGAALFMNRASLNLDRIQCLSSVEGRHRNWSRSDQCGSNTSMANATLSKVIDLFPGKPFRRTPDNRGCF